MSDMARESAAPVGTRKIGLLSMGIVLTGAGVVMLLNELGWLDFSGYRWLLPVYLIVLGAETLITRLLLDRKTPEVHLAPGVGSVAITLAALLFIRLWSFLGGVSPHIWYRW